MRSSIACCLSLLLVFALPASAETIDPTLKTAQISPVAPVESAQPERGLAVQRAGSASRVLGPERLAALPRVTQRVGSMTGRGEQQNDWTGPLLWEVLGASGMLNGATPREQAHLAVRITGADGYAAVISLGEISPQLADRPILLADELNGAPLPDHSLRLIVPGDRLGARSVRDVVRIDIE
jgi:DMSO/TMAO reductase YedYZ molybdopterin-dependent catalytic subunit